MEGPKRITSVKDIPLIHEQDDFGTQQYIDGLVEFIRYSESPLTIALQGEWGSGKTSLMNRIFNKLCKHGNEFIGIEVNTWEYSMLSTPEETVIKIIGELVHALSKEDPNASFKVGKFMKDALGIAYRFGRELSKSAFPGAAMIVEGIGVPTDLPGISSDNKSITLSELKKILTNAVRKTITDSNKKGVIVFVDDLDRLNPPLAVQILELLKNIFTLENCIFVLAIDYDVVVKGLEPKFGKLTDKNEREFRSFFDKIIQVPFSLPVNNYKPETFLIKKLREIRYIDDKDLNNIGHLTKMLSQIVEKTVGKNPRSIKRLINSLSLINCISAMGSSDEKTMIVSSSSIQGKIINFAIVAIQISYPRIYQMLVEQADYKKWDINIAKRFKVEAPQSEETEWEDILAMVCARDAYLKSHEYDIKDVLELIKNEITDYDSTADTGKILTGFINRSSITGVGGSIQSSEDVNYAQILSRLQPKVVERIKEKHPEWNFSNRKLGKNGGFKFEPVGFLLQSTLSPINLNNGRISLRLTIPLAVDTNHFPNIQHILDNGVGKVKENIGVMSMIREFDQSTTPLFCEWLMGKSLEERFWEDWNKDGKWQNQKRILHIETTFDLSCTMTEGFDSDDLINAVVTIHEAAWALHEKALALK